MTRSSKLWERDGMQKFDDWEKRKGKKKKNVVQKGDEIENEKWEEGKKSEIVKGDQVHATPREP